MIRALTTAFGLLLCLPGCGVPPAPTLSASSYNGTCTAESDCTPILVGELCSCRCEYAAINIADLPRYQSDRAKISCSGDKLCGPCQQATATCTAGRCAIK